MTASTDPTNAIAAIDGWSLSNQAIETPDLGSTFESKIPGTDQADVPRLLRAQVGDEIERHLTKDSTGWGCDPPQGRHPQ
ncbi:phage tail tube protein [Streptomyces sp. IBSNAI002]|uniref:phage tail tube protein n=1 Tax=Streptomyces sp. IBSNAI002 TaxID=3457500 RepID=UPI003FCFD773